MAFVTSSRANISGVPSASASAIVRLHCPRASQMRSVGSSPCAGCSSKNVAPEALHNTSISPSLSVSAAAQGHSDSGNEKICSSVPSSAISRTCAVPVPISTAKSSNFPFLFISTGEAIAWNPLSMDATCERCDISIEVSSTPS